MKKGIVYIRPNTHDMISPTSWRPNENDLEQMLKVDEMLQEVVPKEKIKFLGVLDERVRQYIKDRGELWRINHVPKTKEERITAIAESEAAVGTRKMYYHSMETGINWLTYNEFCSLGELNHMELAKHLNEIRDHAHAKNPQGNPEVASHRVSGVG